MLEEHAPLDIFVGGGVAAGGATGGNTAAALLVRAREEGLPMPCGLMLFCPFLDFTQSGDTWNTFLGIDRALSAGFLRHRAAIYAGGTDFSDPHLSPLVADVSDFPPTMLVSGTRDILLSDTILMHRKLRRSGVEADLHVMEAMSHGGWDGTAPEDEEIGQEIRRFISRWARRLPRSLLRDATSDG
jgi:acetyl esterase/lipase